jgi:hypothetical protein
MDLYFSQVFSVPEDVLEEYGALDVSVVSDLPAFVDPFLLFNSEKEEYQELHAQILRYLVCLRDRAVEDLDDGTIKNLYMFSEVKQNWLGYTFLGNGGSGLGRKFAHVLYNSLGDILSTFGDESVSATSHLEKLTLIQSGVGRDNISDFATNLIKGFLLSYTQDFAREHLSEEDCATFRVTRAEFSYVTESWVTKSYYLPAFGGDFVLLTPLDMLTRDETWINHADMIRSFDRLPLALPSDQLRAQVNQYFRQQLPRRPKAKERAEAAQRTILEFPELIDYYIKLKEDEGDRAASESARKIKALYGTLVDQVKEVIPHLQANSTFYEKSWTSYDECRARVLDFKDYVENKDGYRVINKKDRRFHQESEVQLFFGLIWCNNEFDVNREPNNGRGPVDFKVSFGSKDKSLIEFKLGSNTQLKRNLQKQVEIYEKANGTRKSVKVIVNYSRHDEARVRSILRELNLQSEESIVVVDARHDNKPSASKA